MSLDRRAFLGGLAALSATACARTDPCGTHNPWEWIGWEDAQSAAMDVLGTDVTPWAGVEGTADRIQAFRESIDHYALRPRVLVDVRRIDLSTTLLGRPLDLPFVVGSGVLRLPAPGVGDAVIRGARALGVPFLRESGVIERRVPRSAPFATVSWHDFDAARHPARATLAAGIRSPGDARAAVSRGARALVVSNDPQHADDGATSLDLLPEIRAAVPDEVELVVDGAFRHAGGVLVALGLGARAVLVGWPLVWGALAAGHTGAYRVLQLLQTELARDLRLCGRPVLAKIGPDLTRHVAPLRRPPAEAPISRASLTPGPAIPRG